MSIFDRLFKARDKPGEQPSTQNTLPGGGYSFFVGSTSSGKAINERNAMQMT